MMMEGATNLSMMHANHHHQVQTPVAAFHVTIPATTEAGETITVSRTPTKATPVAPSSVPGPTAKKTLGPKKKEVPTWPIQCKKCLHYLHDLEQFYKHMVDHWSEDNICPMCGKEKAVKKEQDKIRTSRNNFRTHLMLHTGEMPFTCNTCGSGFRQKSHMLNHVKKNHSDGKEDPPELSTQQVKKKSKPPPTAVGSAPAQTPSAAAPTTVHPQLPQQPTNYTLLKPEEQQQQHQAMLVQYQQQQQHAATVAAAAAQQQAAAAAAAAAAQSIPQDVRSLVNNALAQQETEQTTAFQQLIPAAAAAAASGVPRDVRRSLVNNVLLQQIGGGAATAYDHTQLAAAAAAAQHQSSVAAGSQPAAANQVAYLSGNEFIGYLNPQSAAAVQRVIVQQEGQVPMASDFSAISAHRPS